MIETRRTRGLDDSNRVRDDVLRAARFRRRVALIRRAGLLEASEGDVQYRRATTFEELKAAYALVHDTFVHQGYIVPQPNGLRLRVFEALPEMATFIAKAGRRVVGVMSLVPDTHAFGLPSDQAFREDLDPLRRQGRWIGEVTNLAVASDYRRSNVFLELSRCICAHASNIGLDDVFSAISPGHSEFFERILRFEPWGDARFYCRTTHDVVEGKRLDINQLEVRAQEADLMLGEDAFLYDWFVTNNMQYRLAARAAHEAAERFLDPAMLTRLFGGPGGLLARCTPQQLQGLRQHWGDELFNQINQSAAVLAA